MVFMGKSSIFDRVIPVRCEKMLGFNCPRVEPRLHILCCKSSTLQIKGQAFLANSLCQMPPRAILPSALTVDVFLSKIIRSALKWIPSPMSKALPIAVIVFFSDIVLEIIFCVQSNTPLNYLFLCPCRREANEKRQEKKKDMVLKNCTSCTMLGTSFSTRKKFVHFMILKARKFFYQR